MFSNGQIYPPSASKLEELRDEGDVPRGQGLVAAGVLSMLVVWALFQAPSLYDQLVLQFKDVLGCLSCVAGQEGLSLPKLTLQIFSTFVWSILSLGISLSIGAALGILIESGFYIRLFGRTPPYPRTQRFIRHAVSLLTVSLFVLLFWGAQLPKLLEGLGKGGASSQFLKVYFGVGEQALLFICAVATFVGIIIVVVDRIGYYRRNGMTRSEIEAEARENSVRPEFRQVQLEREEFEL